MQRLRNVDVYEANSYNVSVMLASNANPRSIKIVLDKTKNDSLGTGPVTGRTHLIPCFCPTYLVSIRLLLSDCALQIKPA